MSGVHVGGGATACGTPAFEVLGADGRVDVRCAVGGVEVVGAATDVATAAGGRATTGVPMPTYCTGVRVADGAGTSRVTTVGTGAAGVADVELSTPSPDATPSTTTTAPTSKAVTSCGRRAGAVFELVTRR
jgi:hypothetical protein